MNLPVESHFQIDKIVKSFEVAYRSFVVEIMRNKFNNKNDFLLGLDNAIKKAENSTFINSKKYSGKLNAIKGKYEDHYKVICDCFNSYQSKTYVKHDVPYVSTIVDYVELFFNPEFANSDLIKVFKATEFLFFSEKYYNLRNTLSHPASEKISLTDVKYVLHFIEKLLPALDDKYFWYIGKLELTNDIAEFRPAIEGYPRQEDIPLLSFSFQNPNFLLMSEQELSIILQDISRIYKNTKNISFDIIINEERMIYKEITELESGEIDIINKQNISDLKDILSHINKIKEEIKFKVTSVVLIKIHEGYSNYPFEPFSSLLFQLLSKLWEVQIICEETIITNILQVPHSLWRRTSSWTGMKLDIFNRDQSISFSIFEPKENVIALYNSRGYSAKFDQFQFLFCDFSVFDLGADVIISKVFFSFISRAYHEYQSIKIEDIGITSFQIGIG